MRCVAYLHVRWQVPRRPGSATRARSQGIGGCEVHGRSMIWAEEISSHTNPGDSDRVSLASATTTVVASLCLCVLDTLGRVTAAAFFCGYRPIVGNRCSQAWPPPNTSCTQLIAQAAQTSSCRYQVLPLRRHSSCLPRTRLAWASCATDRCCWALRALVVHQSHPNRRKPQHLDPALKCRAQRHTSRIYVRIINIFTAWCAHHVCAHKTRHSAESSAVSRPCGTVRAASSRYRSTALSCTLPSDSTTGSSSRVTGTLLTKSQRFSRVLRSQFFSESARAS
jgi:hypothetical protein